ncbi:MAG: Cys-tRNA(Pro) deacylase [Acidimicrobiales bacterium]|jgi:Cys-tRNA(Pro)/Cys-tRNA(Cys) deacylase
MTPAVELLRSLGIAHRIIEYDHDPSHRSFGEEAVEALGVDPAHVFKTLMVTLDDATHAIGVIPVNTRLDLKAIAAAAGRKRATMTDPTQAERRSGYVVGGISPFGQRQTSPTFVDESALRYDELYCSAGRRGVEIAVGPKAFEHALDATFAPISAAGMARVAP